jgi:hypothetical protein
MQQVQIQPPLPPGKVAKKRIRARARPSWRLTMRALSAILEAADADRCCRVAEAHLADRAGMSLSTFNQAKGRLGALGFITIEFVLGPYPDVIRVSRQHWPF